MTPWDPATGLTGGLAAQAWQAAMLGLWNAGLWLLGLVLHLEDALLTPDLRADGPAGQAYGLTLWMAAALGGVMLLAQLLVALLRRDAHSLGAALLGCAKFVVVWVAWVGWAAAVVWATGGVTRAVLRSLLRVSSFADWQPSLRIAPEQAVSVTVATVLGLLGMVLWLAALGHLLVMLGRAVTLLVLAATTPVAAAGLVGELGRGWFWRSVRWFHAAALTPLLMALLLGVGVQTTGGVTDGLADGAARAVGAALPGVLLILTSCFAPLALFRLLAFVDPATPSGAGFRQAVLSALQAGQLLGAPGRWSSAAEHQTADDAPGTQSGPSSPSSTDTRDTTSDSAASASRRHDAESSLQSTVSSSPSMPEREDGGGASPSSAAGPGATGSPALSDPGPGTAGSTVATEVSAVGPDHSAAQPLPGTDMSSSAGAQPERPMPGASPPAAASPTVGAGVSAAETLPVVLL